MKKYLAILLVVLTVGLYSNSYANTDQPMRIVTAGGAITEVVYQLGFGDQVVGVDKSSTYPDAVKDVKSVGYWKKLSSEGILSLSPTLVITWEDSEPAATLAQLRQLGINLLLLKRVPGTPEQFVENIKTIANALGAQKKGDELAKSIETRLTKITAKVAQQSQRPKVLFLFSIMSGPTQIAGKNTMVDSLITIAGGDNIATHQNYQMFSAESFITANPEVIVLTTQGLESLGGIEQLGKIQGITQTNAWKNQRIIALDQAILLGMGPRVGDAIEGLYQAFYPTTK